MAAGNALTGLLAKIEGIIATVRADAGPAFTGAFAVIRGLLTGAAVPARDTALFVIVIAAIAGLTIRASLNPRRRAPARKSLKKKQKRRSG